MADLTILLQRAADGDDSARAELAPLVYEELRDIAERSFARQPRDHTLQATALVHEAWMRLARGESLAQIHGREHFLRTAARAMRQILVDHARAKSRDKRSGGGERVALDGPGVEGPGLDGLCLANEVSAADLIEVDDALGELRQADPELADLVELRYFGGYPMVDVAELTGVSLSTAERRWRLARAFLRRSL